jgi:hypothetical protein
MVSDGEEYQAATMAVVFMDESFYTGSLVVERPVYDEHVGW